MPVVDETGMPLAPYSGVQGIQVLKIAGENKKEAVEKVLRLLMDPGLQVTLAKASGCAPAIEACYEMDEICPLSRIDGQKNIRYNGKERGQRKWKTNGKKG